MADAEDPNKKSRSSRALKFLGVYWRSGLVIFVPIIFLPIFLCNNTPAFRCLYVVAVMAVFWVTEALPIAITSLMPVVLFPIMGILDTNTTCMSYFKETNVMFIGGLILALAIEFSNLHIRIALKTLSIIGCSNFRLLFGLMFITMFISMWISNTAATAMMLPIIRATLQTLEEQVGVNQIYKEGPLQQVEKDMADNQELVPNPSKTTICFYLGCAYASTIGGCGAIIGTGTNLTFKGIYESRFPDAPGIDFPKWMLLNVPPMLVKILLIYLNLLFLYLGLFKRKSVSEIETSKEAERVARAVIASQYKDLGPWRSHEIGVAILFILSIILYFTRSPGFIPGWADVITKTSIKDATPAIIIVLLLFALPAEWTFYKFCTKTPDDELPKQASQSLMTWKYVHTKMPWNLVFLLGGGFALASGGVKSGMASLIGNALSGLKNVHPLLVLFTVILAAELITELTSNVAVANILLPIVAEMTIVMGIHPLTLMYPVAIACSYAFHMPVGTPPNALVAGYVFIRTKDMAIAGIGPTIITTIILWLTFATYAKLIHPELSEFPEWANATAPT